MIQNDLVYSDFFLAEPDFINFCHDLPDISQGVGLLIFDPDMLKNDLIKKGKFHPLDMQIDVHPFRQDRSSFPGKEMLHLLTLDSQIKPRQRQKEDGERNQYYFPAFFNNFAF